LTPAISIRSLVLPSLLDELDVALLLLRWISPLPREACFSCSLLASTVSFYHLRANEPTFSFGRRLRLGSLTLLPRACEFPSFSHSFFAARENAHLSLPPSQNLYCFPSASRCCETRVSPFITEDEDSCFPLCPTTMAVLLVLHCLRGIKDDFLDQEESPRPPFPAGGHPRRMDERRGLFRPVASFPFSFNQYKASPSSSILQVERAWYPPPFSPVSRPTWPIEARFRRRRSWPQRFQLSLYDRQWRPCPFLFTARNTESAQGIGLISPPSRDGKSFEYRVSPITPLPLSPITGFQVEYAIVDSASDFSFFSFHYPHGEK